VGQRLFQLLQLRCRALYFYPCEISHAEHLREQHANVVQMCENAFGVGVAFAAENFVAVNAELGCTFPARLVADALKKVTSLLLFAEGQSSRDEPYY